MPDLSKHMRYGLRDWAEREPDRFALTFTDGMRVTFAELESLANRYANLYRFHGLQVGEHIAVVFGNTHHMLAAAWAAYRTGVYFTPVPNMFSPKETTYVVANAEARLFVAEANYASSVTEVPQELPSLPCYALGGEIEGFSALEPALASMSEQPGPETAVGSLMLYSSGTTGAPKGIWRPLPAPDTLGDGAPTFARDLHQIFGYTDRTRYLSTAPMYHAAPLRHTLAISAAGGYSVVMGKFDAALALAFLAEEKITTSQWVPAMFRRLLALPDVVRNGLHAPDHTVALHAAAPCPPSLKRAMIEWWGPILREYYSGTEGIGLATLDSHEWMKKPGSVGSIVKGKVYILDENANELQPGQTGAIYFSGVSKFSYFGDPAKTAARTSPQGYQTFGDIGYVDKDGYLYLSDRMDDVLISGGVNIYPQEIEAALQEMAGVFDCAVVGVPDEDFGERPVAFVVRSSSDRRDDRTFLSEIESFARKRLGKTKQLKAFHLVTDLPRSPTGKVLRRQLRQAPGLTVAHEPGIMS